MTYCARRKLSVKEELELFVRDGISEKELADAKKGMQQRQTSRSQDGYLAASNVKHLKTGRTMVFTADAAAQLQALTVAQVNAAIKKYIEPSKFFNVYAGDFAGAAKKAAAAAAVNPAEVQPVKAAGAQ